MKSNIAQPLQILEEISQKQLSGCLVVQDPQDRSVSWELYVNCDELYYVTSSIGQKERFSYLRQQLFRHLNPPEFEYRQLCNWWLQQNLPLPQLKQLVLQATQEALVHVLSLEATTMKFIPDRSLELIVLNCSWRDLAEQSHGLIEQWHELRSCIYSPFSRLYINSANLPKFYSFWRQLNGPEQKFLKQKKLSFWLNLLSQKHSLYQIARQVQIEPLQIASQFQELVKTGVLEVLPFQGTDSNFLQQQKQQRPLVVCIDDSRTVQTQVKRTLEYAGYQVLNITDPTSTLTTLVRQKPSLILMDINMPDINGYELCRLLRRSRKLKKVPIVMLTGRDGIIDKLQAQIVGAVQYLTKPFDPNQLIKVVQRLAPSESLAPTNSVNSVLSD